MKNLNASAKSRGVLLFAFNTDRVDYEKIAERSAALISANLDLPVTVITDKDVDNDYINYRAGFAGEQLWRNGYRYLAYELSPYNETILLDSDYLVLDQSLFKILDTVIDYSVMTNNRNLDSSMDTPMGPLSLDQLWATVIVFNRSRKARLLFELAGRIQRNYGYYCKLYNLNEFNFRNDYAFAIAHNIVNGYENSRSIPWPMLTIDKIIDKIELKKNSLVIRLADQAYVLPRQNIHIMDKDYLLSDEFGKLVDELCQN